MPLVRNPDVLAELVTKRAPGQLVVGFAAETGDDEGDVLTHARAKLARKGCDLLVVNDVSAGQVFGRAGQRRRRPGRRRRGHRGAARQQGRRRRRDLGDDRVRSCPGARGARHRPRRSTHGPSAGRR